ncbi:DNA polymerase IV [Aurantimicrobium sp. INA4]|uniref:DNA polymerase IV n=1 Tax=Aurantimicrobium sp. INA4 TaxID=2986279 RepID=UPI00249307A1|nr:DNA polymerase IV [Aurantimicrobium sp. INA4]BDU10645.1 DNA polymerase IV [Aurantimicrobium sp. INA4]
MQPLHSVSLLGGTAPNILHIDMDAFFASVEVLDRPEVAGKPAVVAHDSPRSVVTSATYEARALGIRSAMPLVSAKRLCPDVIVLEPHFEKYRAYSKKVMSIFHDFTPVVEQLSIDEAFLDVSGAQKIFGTPEQIAQQIKDRVRDETGLPCSVGVASTKFVAKLASTKSKPNGLLVIPDDETLAFLHPLPIEAIWGVGKKTAEVLHKRGLHTVADIAQSPPASLISALGQAAGTQLFELSWARDPRPVTTQRAEKSIGKEHTFNEDVTDAEKLKATLLFQADHVGAQLRKAQLEARTIGLKVTFSDFESLTRSRTLPEATSVGREIHKVVCELLDELKTGGRAIRLIGVRAESLVDAGTQQLSLWGDEGDAWKEAEIVMDQVGEKFGPDSVRPASFLRKIEPTRESGTPG